jgi:hypothetical protein
MALMYDSGPPPARPPKRIRLCGTRHEGPEWTRTVRDLRKVTKAAAEKASWRPGVTPDSVGVPLLKILPELDPGSLHVLAVVSAILARQSRR